MATDRIVDVTEQLDEILDADAAAPATERRKFIPEFRGEIQDCFDGLSGKNTAIPVVEGGRLAASQTYKDAIAQGREWVRTVHHRVEGLPPGTDKHAIFAGYGFVADKVGRLNDDDVIFKLTAFPTQSAAQPLPAAQLPADWLATIAGLVATIGQNKPQAAIGTRSDDVKERDALLERAKDLISRVLGYLTYALPLRDRDPMLHDYGFTPRQKAVRPETPAPMPQ